MFRGTRGTHTFRAGRPGRLWLASYFPGEWADPSGTLATRPEDYRALSGGLAVILLRWSGEPLEEWSTAYDMITVADSCSRRRTTIPTAASAPPIRARARSRSSRCATASKGVASGTRARLTAPIAAGALKRPQ